MFNELYCLFRIKASYKNNKILFSCLVTLIKRRQLTRTINCRFGVVCAFVTNEYMQEGTKELPCKAKTSLKDVKLYLTTTKLEIDNLLKTNPEELEVTLNNILQASGKIVTEQLAEYSHAVSLTNLNDIVAGLESIREDLRLMNKITQELRINASQLDIGTQPVFLNSLSSSELKKNHLM